MDISDNDELKNRIENMYKAKYFHQSQIKKLENLIEETKKKIVQSCNHEWVTQREDGQYGELYTTCKKCGLDRYRHIIY